MHNTLKTFKAIVGFRETERKGWSKANQEVIQRLRNVSFNPAHRQLPYTHVLDLAEDGYIKPHIDSVRVKTIQTWPSEIFLSSKIVQ